MRSRSKFGDFVSHSHITSALQPRFVMSTIFNASRSTFRLNLARHISTFVLGRVAFGQPRWRCQKQPCTNTAIRYFGKTKSGAPGRSRRCNRYRYPKEKTSFLTIISGVVFLLFTALMISLRFSLETRSAMPPRFKNGNSRQCRQGRSPRDATSHDA